MTPETYIIAFLTSVATALDTISTLLFVRALGVEREMNPLMRYLMKVGGGWALVTLNVVLAWVILLVMINVGWLGYLILLYMAGWRLVAGILNTLQYMLIIRRDSHSERG